MKRFDILVVGELNVDLILSDLQSLPRVGAEVIAKSMTMTLGSSSAIFACNAVALGSTVAFLGKLGTDDFGRFVLDFLKTRRVSTDFIIQSPQSVTGATVAFNFGEDRSMVTHPGAMEELSLSDVKREHLESAKHLHLSSIFLQPGIKGSLLQLLKMAKEVGMTTSLDTQWDPAERWDLNLQQILPLVDVFIPNQEELLALTREKSVEAAMNSLGRVCKTVIVKCGRQGARALHDGQILSSQPFTNPRFVDAIGAGDSFDAGVVTRFIRGATIEHCMKAGNLAGALNTTAAGGTTAFADPKMMQETVRQYFQTEISEI